MIAETTTSQIATIISFEKEEDIWFADLPIFLEQGLGTKANLMMVDGADTFLDFLSSAGHTISLQISSKAFEGHDAVLLKESIGLNTTLLDLAGHAPVMYGTYYTVEVFKGQPFQHSLWLCPVTEYVFGGGYPDKIYFSVLK